MVYREIDVKYERILSGLIFGALMVLALGLLTSTTLLSLSHILLIFPCIYFAFKTNWSEIPKSAWALLGLSIAIMLSVIVNQDIMVKGWKPIFKVKYFLFGFFSIVPFHWWIKNKMTEKKLKILFYVFLISTTIATLSGLSGTFFGYNPILNKTVPVGGRYGGLFGMVMNYAHNMSYFLVLLFGVILNSDMTKNLISRKSLILFFLINCAGLFYSYTRGAWLALLIGIPMYFFTKNKKIFITILVLMIIALSSAYMIAGKAMKRKDDDMTRVGQWQAAIYVLKERPLFGLGYLNFEEKCDEIKHKYGLIAPNFKGHAHNNFMEMIGAVGIIGLLGFIFWLILWLNEARSQFTLPFLITFVVGGMTQSTIALGINLFFVMAVFSIMIASAQNLKPYGK